MVEGWTSTRSTRRSDGGNVLALVGVGARRLLCLEASKWTTLSAKRCKCSLLRRRAIWASTAQKGGPMPFVERDGKESVRGGIVSRMAIEKDVDLRAAQEARIAVHELMLLKR